MPTPTLREELIKLLDQKDDKNYDPRMEELMRSDKLIDPKAENLSKLEDQETFHIAKIRGAQKGYTIKISELQKMYNLPWMINYHADYIDYVRNLDPVKDKDLLESSIGGLPMTTEMVSQFIYLRGALEAWKAKLYADSIKPQVANLPPQYLPVPEEKEGLIARFFNFFLGKKKEEPTGYRK